MSEPEPMTAEAKSQSYSEPAWPSSAMAWYAVGVLTFAYLVSFVDRQILSLLIEPIRRDLHITDTQVSLLGGLAFALLYTFAGIPIAWLADHRSRRVIIAIGVTFWSLMTALCGLSKTFWEMFLARVGVGVGEASLTPSAYSMIADFFPRHKLAQAMGVYMAGGAIGGGLALVVGGAVIAWAADLPSLTLPFYGEIQPWQLAFLLVSLPGIVVVVLMATVPEPLRRGKLQTAQQAGGRALNHASKYVRAHWKVYIPLYVGFAMLSLLKNAILVWTPTLFIRTYGWDTSTIGYTYGVFLLVFGALGAVGGGWIADKWRQRGRADASMLIVVIAALLCAPVATAMPLMATASQALVLLATLTLLLFVIGAVTPTAFQLVTPNPLRAQVAAVALFLNNLLGIGLGPTLVALITDYGFGSDMALRYSLAIVAAIFAPLGAVIFWCGLKFCRVQMAANDNDREVQK